MPQTTVANSAVPLALIAAVHAQQLAGEVRDFADAPAAYAIVRAFAADGERLGEVLSDAAGRFAAGFAEAIGYVEVQCEGVRRRVEIADGSNEDLVVGFADVRCFVLRGHLVDPIGKPMTGVDLLLRTPEGETVATTATAAKGAFAIHVDRPVGTILVDPLGLRHVVEGPFERDGGIAIDLRLIRDDFRRIRGRVLDEHGDPLPGAMVRATGERDALLVRRSAADGSYELWSRTRVEFVSVCIDDELVGLEVGAVGAATAESGADLTLDLDLRRCGYAIVAGHVVDTDGQPIPYATIHLADATATVLARTPTLARSDADGNFTARVPRTVPFLLAWQSQPNRSGTSRWQPGAPVTITLR